MANFFNNLSTAPRPGIKAGKFGQSLPSVNSFKIGIAGLLTTCNMLCDYAMPCQRLPKLSTWPDLVMSDTIRGSEKLNFSEAYRSPEAEQKRKEISHVTYGYWIADLI